MWLSKVRVDGRTAQDAYRLHAALLGLLPDVKRKTKPEDDRPYLYAIEDLRTGIGGNLMMLSFIEPQNSGLGATILGKKSVNDMGVVDGGRMAFHLIANPVKSVRDHQTARKGKPDTKLSKKGRMRSVKVRVPLLTLDGRLAWLEHKLQGAARVIRQQPEPQVWTLKPLHFRKHEKPSISSPEAGTTKTRIHHGKIAQVRFEGHLVVEDAKRLLALIRGGIGHGRAFGCGLLLVRRV